MQLNQPTKWPCFFLSRRVRRRGREGTRSVPLPPHRLLKSRMTQKCHVRPEGEEWRRGRVTATPTRTRAPPLVGKCYLRLRLRRLVFTPFISAC